MNDRLQMIFLATLWSMRRVVPIARLRFRSIRVGYDFYVDFVMAYLAYVSVRDDFFKLMELGASQCVEAYESVSNADAFSAVPRTNPFLFLDYAVLPVGGISFDGYVARHELPLAHVLRAHPISVPFSHRGGGIASWGEVDVARVITGPIFFAELGILKETEHML